MWTACRMWVQWCIPVSLTTARLTAPQVSASTDIMLLLKKSLPDNQDTSSLWNVRFYLQLHTLYRSAQARVQDFVCFLLLWAQVATGSSLYSGSVQRPTLLMRYNAVACRQGQNRRTEGWGSRGGGPGRDSGNGGAEAAARERAHAAEPQPGGGRQVLVAAWPEGCPLAALARRQHALRSWHRHAVWLFPSCLSVELFRCMSAKFKVRSFEAEGRSLWSYGFNCSTCSCVCELCHALGHCECIILSTFIADAGLCPQLFGAYSVSCSGALCLRFGSWNVHTATMLTE